MDVFTLLCLLPDLVFVPNSPPMQCSASNRWCSRKEKTLGVLDAFVQDAHVVLQEAWRPPYEHRLLEVHLTQSAQTRMAALITVLI